MKKQFFTCMLFIAIVAPISRLESMSKHGIKIQEALSKRTVNTACIAVECGMPRVQMMFPLDVAVVSGNKETCDLIPALLEQGAEITPSTLRYAVGLCVPEDEPTNAINILLDYLLATKGAAHVKEIIDSERLICLAADCLKINTIRRLIQLGGKVALADADGKSPLHYVVDSWYWMDTAQIKSRIDLITLLCSHEADLNARENHRNLTPAEFIRSDLADFRSFEGKPGYKFLKDALVLLESKGK